MAFGRNRAAAESFENRGSNGIVLGLALLFFSLALLSTGLGRIYWPAGHQTLWRVVHAVAGEEQAAVRLTPFEERGSAAGLIEAPAPLESGRALADVPVGAEACALNWRGAAPDQPIGYCAEVLAHDGPSDRVLLRVQRLIRTSPGVLTGACATADGLHPGQKLWVPTACLQ
ncbi:MAG: hypothetical protein AAFW46_15375 [Pseudomonadota bacterium]